MAATNAARHLGLDGVGRIEAGARADLCVVDEDGALQRVMQAGRWLPSRCIPMTVHRGGRRSAAAELTRTLRPRASRPRPSRR